MADVEAQGGTPGNHVRDPRFHVEHADGRDQAGLGRRRGLDRQHQLRGGGQRVSAPVHRHGPRVARLAGELDQHPALARDRRDDADGQGTRLEHRPLLDVHLAVTEEVAAHFVIGDSRRVAAERANRFGHGDAGRVGPLQVAGVKGAGHRAAAEVGGAVAKSFLVGEGQDLDSERQLSRVIVDALHRRQRDHDPERTVVLTRVAHRVQVRAEQQGRVARAFVPAAQVADVVSRDRHPCLAHPLADVLMRPPHRVRGEGPRDPAGLVGAGREHVTPLDDRSTVDHG